MGEVTDKFRKVCNKIDGLPDYPVDWLPELFAIASDFNKSIAHGAEGITCFRKDVQRFMDKFGAFQKKYARLKNNGT